MPQSWADFLAPLCSLVPDALIGLHWLVRILDLVGRLPVEWAPLIFECHLGEGNPRADFAVLVQQGRGRDLLAGLDPRWDFRGELVDDPVWQRVRAFARRWADPESALHSLMRDVWLEFDLDELSPRQPSPNVFLSPGFYASGGGHTLNYLSLLVPTFELLREQTLAAPILRMLERAFATLPAGAWVPWIAAMIARPTETIRLCISGLKPESVLDYVAALDWPGSRDELGALLRRCADLFLSDTVVVVHLDLDTSLQPRIGLEGHLPEHGPSQARSQWDRILKHGVAQGWCTPAKRTGLLQFHGVAEMLPAFGAWPSPYPFVQPCPGESSHRHLLFRTINHIKFVHRPGLPLQAKAYVDIRAVSLPAIANPAAGG
jgi:hypothetical protein